MSRANVDGSLQDRRRRPIDRDGRSVRHIDTEIKDNDGHDMTWAGSRHILAFKEGDVPTRSPASSFSTDITTPSTYNGASAEIPGFAGWTCSPRLRDAWSSRTTLNTNQSNDSPITPMSPIDNPYSFKNIMTSSPTSQQDEFEAFSTPLSLPIRIKEQVKPSAQQPLHLTPQELDTELLDREPTPKVEDQSHQSGNGPVSAEATEGIGLSKISLPSDEAFTSIPSISRRALNPVQGVLKYTLQETFGWEHADLKGSLSTCETLVRNFLSDIAWAVDQDTCGFCQVGGLDRNATNASNSTTITRSSQHSSTSSSRSDHGKRKARSRKNEEDEEDEYDDIQGNGSRQSSMKRAKFEKPLRMSCPYRKKNPVRFNVRDHRLCALTVFYNTSELRRHIQDFHRQPTTSSHTCARCRTEFQSNDDLRQHMLFLNGVCPINEESRQKHDPEDGIDDDIAEKLRTKRGRVSDPIKTQWEKIWDLLFPGTLVLPYDYCAVMEHFELYDKYCDSLPHLKGNLRGLGLGGPGLETLGSILDNHLIGLFEECNQEGKEKDYHNRQPKPLSSFSRPPRSAQSSLRRRVNRDSACDMVVEENLHEHGLIDDANGGTFGSTEAAWSREQTASQGYSPQMMLQEQMSTHHDLASSLNHPHSAMLDQGHSISNQEAFVGMQSVPDLSLVGIHPWDAFTYDGTGIGWDPTAYCSQPDSGGQQHLAAQTGPMSDQRLTSQQNTGNGNGTVNGVQVASGTGFVGFGHLPTRHR